MHHFLQAYYSPLPKEKAWTKSSKLRKCRLVKEERKKKMWVLFLKFTLLIKVVSNANKIEQQWHWQPSENLPHKMKCNWWVLLKKNELVWIHSKIWHCFRLDIINFQSNTKVQGGEGWTHVADTHSMNS